MVNLKNTFNRFWNNTEDTGITVNTAGTAANTITWENPALTGTAVNNVTWYTGCTHDLTIDTGTDLTFDTTANACWSGPSFRKVSKKEFMVGMPQHNIKKGVYNADTWQGTCTGTLDFETTDRTFATDWYTPPQVYTTNNTTAGTANTRLTYG